MKQIKYLNWESIFFHKILEFRSLEFNRLKIAKYLDAFCVFFWACTSILISAVTFIAYIELGNDL